MLRIKKYIKVFLILSITLMALIWLGFGTLVSPVIIIKNSFKLVIFIIILILIDYLKTRKLPQEAIYVHQEREIQIKGNFENIFEQCLNIIKKLKAVKSVNQTKEKMMISARTKMTMFSSVNVITLRFDISNEQFIKIHIESRPFMSFALFDFGRNYRNVEWLKKKLNQVVWRQETRNGNNSWQGA
jgi:uncharacterized protein (DUF1499 family)